jgi:hypothetical protein
LERLFFYALNSCAPSYQAKQKQDSTCRLPYNPANTTSLKINMQQPRPKPVSFSKIIFIVSLMLLAPQLAAEDMDQLTGTELKDKWGQVIFCQRIYTMPEVRTRLYDFDIEQCEAASLLIADLADKYIKSDQQAMKLQAEKHATALSYNTSEPYHSVPACRDYCKKLEQIRAQRNSTESK